MVSEKKWLRRMFRNKDVEEHSDEIFCVYYGRRPDINSIAKRTFACGFVAALERLPADFDAKWRVNLFPISYLGYLKCKNTDFYKLMTEC
nr:MAG: hypothetical protein [Lokiarchaeota virus Ratatoskr Meg22_1012]